MTVLDAAAPGRSLRRHSWLIILSLSLALNLFFVGGALWTRLHAPAPLTREQRFDQVAAALDLDPAQRQAFARYSQTMQGWLLDMRKAAHPLVRAAWAEVSKPRADETKVMQLLDQATQVRRAYLGKITATTITFLQTLSPQQRAEFIKVAHSGPAPWALQFAERRR